MDHDYDDDESQPPYWQETQRLYALNEFLKQGAMLPNRLDGALDSELMKDYKAAAEEALEAVRRIASRS